MSLFIAFIFYLMLLGWGLTLARWLKTDLSIGLFNAVALNAIVMLFSFLGHTPQLAACGLLGCGWLLLLNPANKPVFSDSKPTILAFFLLGLLSLLMAHGIKFRSIDDYSFWGTMSKYLFVFNALPIDNQYINASYLTYIPGMASFHYLIYYLGQHYSQWLGYCAQSTVFFSALLVVFNAKTPIRSLTYISIYFIVFTLAFGTVLAKMEVDAFVAAYLFSISWLIYQKKSAAGALIFIPLVFLSTIKEIGLLFAFFSIIGYLVSEKITRKTMKYVVGMSLAILGTKFAWKVHVNAYGFHSFAQGITFDAAMQSLNPFNAYYHSVQVLYLKEVFLASFDHLIKIPYGVLYALIGATWYYRIKKNNLITLYVACIVIYLCMLYWLQAIVFGVGHLQPEILGFQRYYNMLFTPLICLITFISLERVGDEQFTSFSKALPISCLIIASIMLLSGKIERNKRFYAPNQLFEVYQQLENKVHSLRHDAALCLNDVPEPTYQLSMPLTYFLMPQKVLVNKEKYKECASWKDLNYGRDRNLRTVSKNKKETSKREITKDTGPIGKGDY